MVGNEETNNTFVQDLISAAGGEAVQEQTEPQGQPQEPKEPQTAVITDDMVNQWKLPTSMVGKPITEVLKSYKNIEKQFTKVSQELAGLKKAPPPEKEITAIEEPDPADFESKAEYQKAMRAYMDYRESNLENRILSKINPQLEVSQKQAQQQNVQALMTAIQTEIPNADVEQVVLDYINENADEIEDMKPVYGKNPKLLVKHIVNDYRAKNKTSVPPVKQAVKQIVNAPVKESNYSQRVSAQPQERNFVQELVAGVEAHARESDPYLFQK